MPVDSIHAIVEPSRETVTPVPFTTLPTAVPVTSAQALNNATLHYGLQLADKGLKAIAEDRHLRAGLNVHRGRVTIRRQVTCDDGSTRTVYVKREKFTPLRYQLGHLAAGRGLWTKARAEFEMLRRLRSAGFRCPRPIACVERGWPLRSGMLQSVTSSDGGGSRGRPTAALQAAECAAD